MIAATCLCHQIIHDVLGRSHGLNWGRDEPSPGQMDRQNPISLADEQTGHVLLSFRSVMETRATAYVAIVSGPARALAAHLRSRAKIAAKTFCGAATSASWKVTYFE